MRKEPTIYKPYDLVLLRSKTPATGESRKLEMKYKGPYEVVKALGNDRYFIQDIEGEQQSGRLFKGIFAVDRFKKVPTEKDNTSGYNLRPRNGINFDEDVDDAEMAEL